MVICGDFNFDIDWRDYSSTFPDEQRFITGIEKLNLTQSVQFPTTREKTLDLVLVSPSTDVLDIKPVTDNISKLSDHILVAFVISSVLYSPKRTTPGKVFSYTKANYEPMRLQISRNPFTGHCWSNPNVLLSEWYDWLQHIISKTVPIRTKHRSELPPWITSSTSNEIKRLHTFEKKFGRSNPKTTKQNEKVTVLTGKDKENYENELASNMSKNQLFKYFRTFKTTTIPSYVYLDKLCAYSDQSKADLFASFFSSVFILSSSLDDEDSIQSNQFLAHEYQIIDTFET